MNPRLKAGDLII